MVTLKLTNGTEVRRFSNVRPNSLHYHQFCLDVQQIFTNLGPSFHIKYTDDEDEVVSIGNDAELQEAIQIAEQQNRPSLRITIEQTPLHTPLLPLSGGSTRNDDDNNNNNNANNKGSALDGYPAFLGGEGLPALTLQAPHGVLNYNSAGTGDLLGFDDPVRSRRGWDDIDAAMNNWGEDDFIVFPMGQGGLPASPGRTNNDFPRGQQQNGGNNRPQLAEGGLPVKVESQQSTDDKQTIKKGKKVSATARGDASAAAEPKIKHGRFAPTGAPSIADPTYDEAEEAQDLLDANNPNKLQARRARNRVSARRSRMRKKMYHDSLQAANDVLTAENKRLKGWIRSLQEEVAALKGVKPAQQVTGRTKKNEAKSVTKQTSLLAGDVSLLSQVDFLHKSFCLCDPNQVDNPIIYCSDTFVALTGYPRSEILGRNCRFLQGPKTDPKAVQAIRSAIEKGNDAHVQILNYRKDRSMFWNNFFIAALRDEKGKVVQYLGVQQEISFPDDSKLQQTAMAVPSSGPFPENLPRQVRLTKPPRDVQKERAEKVKQTSPVTSASS